MENTGYQRTVLDNGLRVLTEKMPHLRSVSVGVWIDVGSRSETTPENGVSHFIEHMSFKGTKTRSAREIARSLESLGGTLNAFTTREHTCYYARVLDDHFEVAIDVLADILTNSLFDSQEIDRERKVILEEIKDLHDTPSDLVHDYYAATIWESHPLGRSILGAPETVKAIARDGIIDYVQRHYTTDQVVISAAGNVDHERLVQLAGEKFSFAVADGRHQLQPPQYNQGRKQIFARDSAQTHVCLGVPTLPFSHPDKYTLLILNTVLGSGMGSRLFQSLREQRGLAYTIYSTQDYYHDTGIFSVYLGTEATKVTEAVELVLTEFQDIKANALDEEELAAAKSQLIGGIMLALEGSYSRMSRMARHELFLRSFTTLDETIAEINAITIDNIKTLVGEIFTTDRLVLAVLGPVDKSVVETIDWSILK